ncbi:hypothetical protein [Serratia marcescens]|uniref:hypothetical protein n=1 Tax=Serratia marcescens TaxID=615 RepID=UPI00224388AE|nr:hypothetical protein [Serratia marcescens]
MFTGLLSDERNLQITALVEELADNGHNVAGVVREVEVMRYYILQRAIEHGNDRHTCSVYRTADEGTVIIQLKMRPGLDEPHASYIDHAVGKM